MKQSVSWYDFDRAFLQCRPDNFSYNGRFALFEYLERLEDDMGEELELDVIAFCCDFTEYESLDEFQSDYDDQFKSIDDIREHTSVIEIPLGGFIVGEF